MQLYLVITVMSYNYYIIMSYNHSVVIMSTWLLLIRFRSEELNLDHFSARLCIPDILRLAKLGRGGGGGGAASPIHAFLQFKV